MLKIAKWYLLPSITLLLLSQLDWDYGYYQFLRVVVSFTSFYLLYLYWQEDSNWKVIYGAVGFIFNPFLPVSLEREIWVVIDYLVAGLFIYEFLKKR